MEKQNNIISHHSLIPLAGHANEVNVVAWSPDGSKVASGSDDNTVRVWSGENGALLHTLQGHTDAVRSVGWSPYGSKVVSGSEDNTVRLWSGESGALLHTLEGHTAAVNSVGWSPDGEILVSLSDDETMHLWHPQSWETVAIVEGITTPHTYDSLYFFPHASLVSSLDVVDTAVHLWKIDVAAFRAWRSQTSSVHYTTAKIALVGDSSIGKSGLGYRLAESRFQVTESSHGQQFWIVDELGTIRDDGTQCEAILWDFAGQPTFRPIHALFLEDIDIALILFDPTRPDTLSGVDYWLKHLEDEQHSCRIILVAARSDVSQSPLSLSDIQAFCRERNIDGGFVVTSAKLGEGIDTLLNLIRQQIGWDAKPTTVTTQTFKRIKDYVLNLKANAEQTPVLVNLAQLRSLLETSDPDWQFSDDELKGALSHLQNHGYITILRHSSTEEFILLKPDLLINLAASYLFQAQKNERGLGALDEARVLRGEYKLPEVEQRSEEERSILLNAVTELFLKRNICFREAVDGQTFLIFPSLIFDRPQNMVEDTTLDEDMTYIVSGKVENIYPALVVLLGYAPSFQRMYQWRKQAQYETQDGQICSFKLISNEIAELELVLYYGKDTAKYMRMRFQGLFEQILLTRSVTVERYRPIICPECGYQQSRQRVIERIQQGKDFVFCEENGERISLPKATDLTPMHQMRAEIARDEVRGRQRTSYETALVRLKDFILDRGDTTAVTCFVSYAWGILEHERWVLSLANDLRNAGIEVVLDQLHNAAIGSNIARFIERIEESAFIVAIGTPSYLLKYRNKLSKYGSVVAAEVDLINQRLLETEERKATVLPVLLDGDKHTSLPPLMRRVFGDFTSEEMYFATLFDLLLTLYQIPFEHPKVQDVRANLRGEAQSPMKSGKIGRGRV